MIETITLFYRQMAHDSWNAVVIEYNNLHVVDVKDLPTAKLFLETQVAEYFGRCKIKTKEVIAHAQEEDWYS